MNFEEIIKSTLSLCLAVIHSRINLVCKLSCETYRGTFLYVSYWSQRSYYIHAYFTRKR